MVYMHTQEYPYDLMYLPMYLLEEKLGTQLFRWESLHT